MAGVNDPQNRSMRRRDFLLEPGESLLLPSSALDIALRYGMFERFTALPGDAILSTSLVATPLVVPPASGHPARVYKQMNPAALWHPLFWLPQRLAGRYLIQDEAGLVDLETDQQWAVRVALELSASGLYDVASGTWLDVLALDDLEVDDEATLDRLRAWQTGTPDDVLDYIDLSRFVDVQDQDWAVESAVILLDDLVPASAALLANDLIASLDELTNHGSKTSHDTAENAHQAVTTAISLGDTLLAPVTELDRGFWSGQRTALNHVGPHDTDRLVSGPVASIMSALYRVRDALWPHVEALHEAERPVAPQHR